MRKVLGWAELALALLAVIGAVASWNAGVRSTEFAAVPEESPAFVGTFYSGPWIALAAFAGVLAGLLAIDGVRRLWTADVPHTG